MRIKTALLASSLAIACFAPQIMRADTLKLESTDNGIFPYTFSIDGSKTLTQLSCLNDTRTVTIGETWNVTATDLQNFTGSIDGSSAKSLDEDAYLDSLYNTAFDGASNTEIQDAIWDILDPSDYSKLDSTSKTLVADAGTFVALNSASSSFYSQFTLYTPTSNTSGWTKGEPQEFLEYTPGTPNVPPGITPEPSSLMLFGTGLLGAVGIMRRRYNKTALKIDA